MVQNDNAGKNVLVTIKVEKTELRTVVYSPHWSYRGWLLIRDAIKQIKEDIGIDVWDFFESEDDFHNNVEMETVEEQ